MTDRITVETQPGSIVAEFPALAPLSANDRHHWAAQARRVADWRELGYHVGRQIALAASRADTPIPDPARVTFLYVYRTRRRRDPSNLAPTVKALVDGLVDAGLWADDDASHITVAEPRISVSDSGPRAGVRIEAR